MAAVVVFAVLLAAPPCWAQEALETPSADTLYHEARRSAEAENWERAVELYTQGARLFPDNPNFPIALGELYYDRRLFPTALEYYRQAEVLLPLDATLLYRLYEAAGAVNLDADAARYLERLLALDADNLQARLDLGWMYFKLHRLEEGAALIEETTARFGNDISAAMTLATIYSDMFRYEDSKQNYTAAIEGAYQQNNNVFAAIAHYNLFILESRFYHYDTAFQETEVSLRDYDRATGRIARAEMNFRRLDIERGLADYEAAYATDTSPLSKMSLADACQMAGRLEEARKHAESCLSGDDNSWMLRFGIDPAQYKRDLHEILYKTYFGLSNTERFTMYAGLWDNIQRLARIIGYRFKGEVHHLLFKKYALESANAYSIAVDTDKRDAATGEAPHLDALSLYAESFADYPARSVAYLADAAAAETAFIPEAAPYYAYKEGTVRANKPLLRSAAESAHPVWERGLIADAYTELAKRGGKDALACAEHLFALNRGALRQNGISLPVELSIDVPSEASLSRAVIKKMKKAAVKAGFREGGTESRFALRMRLEEGAADCELHDKGRGMVVLRERFPLPSLSAADVAAFSRALGGTAFTE